MLPEGKDLEIRSQRSRSSLLEVDELRDGERGANNTTPRKSSYREERRYCYLVWIARFALPE